MPGTPLAGRCPHHAAAGEHPPELLDVVGGGPPLDRVDHHQKIGIEFSAFDRADDGAVRPGSLLLEAPNARLPVRVADERFQCRDAIIQQIDAGLVELTVSLRKSSNRLTSFTAQLLPAFRRSLDDAIVGRRRRHGVILRELFVVGEVGRAVGGAAVEMRDAVGRIERL
jgi:hypothetical protein